MQNKTAMQNIRDVLKAERHASNDARRCKQCGKWFTVKKRNSNRTLCFRCEEGKASD